MTWSEFLKRVGNASFRRVTDGVSKAGVRGAAVVPSDKPYLQKYFKRAASLHLQRLEWIMILCLGEPLAARCLRIVVKSCRGCRVEDEPRTLVKVTTEDEWLCRHPVVMCLTHRHRPVPPHQQTPSPASFPTDTVPFPHTNRLPVLPPSSTDTVPSPHRHRAPPCATVGPPAPPEECLGSHHLTPSPSIATQYERRCCCLFRRRTTSSWPPLLSPTAVGCRVYRPA